MNNWATIRLPRINGLYAVSIRNIYFLLNFQTNSHVCRTTSMTDYCHLSPTEWRSCVVEFRQLSLYESANWAFVLFHVFNCGTNRLTPNIWNSLCVVDNVYYMHGCQSWVRKYYGRKFCRSLCQHSVVFLTEKEIFYGIHIRA